ncbi:MAG: glycosyltransferase family 39 protein [Patescibacteria group bacterium]
MSSKGWLIFIIAFSFLSRFVGLSWGQGYFFHPDENNMATAVSGLSMGDLNPHFFAYGQFPLYLAFFSLLPFTGDHPPLIASTLILRFWSAVFSLFFLFFAYKIGKTLFKKNSSTYVFLILLIFSPGLIQLAHFGTTESILCLVFMANLYYSLRIFHHPRLGDFLLAALFTGIGLSSKITAIFFVVPIILAAIFTKYKNKLHLLLFTIYYLLFTFLFFIVFSPYNWIDFPAFLSTLKYETAVATGAIEVFYTRQFLFTTPYFFQLTKIFPYTSGIFVFLLSFCGLFSFIKKIPKNQKNWLIVLFSSLIYFLYFGSVFAKWTRFAAPIFFVFPLLSTLFLDRLKSLPKGLLLFFCCLPGFVFWLNYLRPDIRHLAATDINRRAPPGSSILSESGNVTPLPLSVDFQVTDFNFYDLDFNESNQNRLDNLISTSDYILVPSHRVFKNQTSPLFPQSGRYYQELFDGNLGFRLIKKYQPFDLFLNPESAEETWTVFDRPTLRLYKKQI